MYPYFCELWLEVLLSLYVNFCYDGADLKIYCQGIAKNTAKNIMDFVTTIGLCAGTLTTIAFLPQVIKTWRSRSAGDISLSMLITFLVGLCLWLLYGIYLQAPPVIISNFVTILLNLIILWFKLKYK